MKKFWMILILVIVGGLRAEIAFADTASLDDGGSNMAPEVMAPEIFIKAINPGYTIDGKNNVGEMIEIARKDDSDELISLASLTVSYTTSGGKETILVEFPENSFLAGESILLRLASSPDSGLANLNYSKTLALKGGPLELKWRDELIDSVCWSGGTKCYSEFKSSNPTVLVKQGDVYSHLSIDEYAAGYGVDNYLEMGNFTEASELLTAPARQCEGLIFSEVLSYYAETQSEQFVEIYNSVAEQILLDGCKLRYKNKLYPLSGILKPEGYFARYLSDFSITKNPTNSGVIEIIDIDGGVVDKLEYPNGQRKGTAYALIGYDEYGKELWHTTYSPTPGEPNNYQEFKTCEEGKVINEETGNCVKATTIEEKTCEEGQYLNPLTGRCRKIEAESAEKTCEEGYILNKETGRCKKVVENNGADYSLKVENYEEDSSFVALGAVILIVTAGVIYVGYEFKDEIKKFFKRR